MRDDAGNIHLSLHAVHHEDVNERAKKSADGFHGNKVAPS
jgi:hypothetical protein